MVTHVLRYIYILIDPVTEQIRYVGQSYNPVDRLKKHLRMSNHPKTFDYHIYRWIRGLNGVLPLLRIIDQGEDVNDKEKYWINYYLNLGNNLTNQDLVRGFSPASEERKTKNIKHLNKLSEKSSKPILQYDLNGNFIQEWVSIRSANRYFDTKIDSVLSGKKKSAKGFQWKYKESEIYPLKIGNKINERLSPVLKYDLQGNFLQEFPTATSASTNGNITVGNVIACCTNNYKHSGGFQWKYKESEIYPLKIDSVKLATNLKKSVCRMDKSGNILETYDSATDAAKCGYDISRIRDCCRGNKPHHKGFLWRFV